MNPPAFLLYADDLLSGTQDMTNEELGAYVRLLCHQWNKLALPNDPDRLSRMAGAMPGHMLGYVLGKFQAGPDGMLRNQRLERVREELVARRDKASQKGRDGALKRWGKCPGNTKAHDQALPGQSLPSPFPEDTTYLIAPAEAERVEGVSFEASDPLAKQPDPDEKPPVDPTAAAADLPAPAKPRARKPDFDALAEVAGMDPLVLTKGEGGRIGTALSGIKAAWTLLNPDLTPETLAVEIRRRAANYRANMPSMALTPTGLEANWGRCNVANPPKLLKPAWEQRRDLETKIEQHPANQGWIGYNARAVTQQHRDELRQLRMQLKSAS